MTSRGSCHYVQQPHHAEFPDSSFHVGTQRWSSPASLYRDYIEVHKTGSDPARPDSPSQTYTIYTEPRGIYSYISNPPRSHSLSNVDAWSGYCDYCGCQDPQCIERQIAKRGFRDDLRHHEDQDKNGNMRDGGSVGEPVSHPHALTAAHTTYTAPPTSTTSWVNHDKNQANPYLIMHSLQ